GVVIHSLLEGVFNAENILASVSLAEHLNIPLETIARGVTSVSKIKGRVEHVRTGQLFDVVVDYAHTPDSLKKLYEAFPHKKKICVLGNTGGGRDTWKRPEMGKIAGTYCDMVILTNEDPYDEDPEEIVTAIQKGVAEAQKEARIIMDRRTAIYEACLYAQKTEGAVVLISGKGTDPYIMEARGKKTPWDDVTVATEVLEKIART
ncbi:MAG: cyanophycin synthetase, partial [Candidatus Paceibacterota bacterium]